MDIYVLIVWGGDRTTGLKVAHTESSKVLIYGEYSAAVGRCPAMPLREGSRVQGVFVRMVEYNAMGHLLPLRGEQRHLLQ